MRIIIYTVALFSTAEHIKYFDKFQISPKLKKICESSCFTVSVNFVQKVLIVLTCFDNIVRGAVCEFAVLLV